MFEQNKSGQPKKVDTHNIFTVKSADTILSQKKYVEKIDELRKASGMSFEMFDQHYWHLLANFANYLQMLPDPREKNAPLLHVALARAKVAFSHIANHKNERFQYAYVSLSLFADLGVCLTDYDVLICNDQGEVLDTWHPFVRSLADYGGYYYKIRPTNLYPKKIRFDANVVLACAIMPEFGLVYLKEDPQLFSQWLRALTGKDDAGDLSAVLDTTRAFPRSSMLSNIDASLISADMCGDAEAFWAWIKDNVSQKDGYADVNQGKVMLDVEALAKDYAKQFNKDASQLKRQLDKLKVISAIKASSGAKSAYSGFFGGKAQANSKQAVVVSMQAAKKYVSYQVSMNESKANHNASMVLEEQKNQQTT